MSSVFLDNSHKRKHVFRTIIVIFFGALLACITLFTASVFFNSPTRPALTYANAAESYHYYYSSANKGKIAFTFDDGPRPGLSEKLMDELEEHGVPATFFYVGQSILMHPNIVYDAHNRGFSIGNHSFTHAQAVQASDSRLSLELHSTEYLISRITGQSSFYYRPPYLLGIGIDPTMNPYVPIPEDVLWVMQNGYSPVGADIDPEDWLAASEGDVVQGVIQAMQDNPNGHILLLHEEESTIAAIGEIVDAIEASGFTIVPLEELLTPPKELTLTHALSIGDTDQSTDGEVSRLQWFLYKNGNLDPYLITGQFGPATEAALTRFQFAEELANGSSGSASVGVADARTREALHKASIPVLGSTMLNPEGMPGFLVETKTGNFFRDMYVFAFPTAHSVLTVMVRLTLYLVLLRCAVVLLFLAWGKLRRKKSLDDRGLRRMRKQGVSVLIPAYNEQENIQATIESVMRSTHARREIIVIDDGSTDKTGDIVRNVIKIHSSEPIRLIQVENGGKARALNHGLRAARYDVCTVLDADAVLDPDAISYFVAHFADPSVAAVAGKVCTTQSTRTLDMFQTLEYAIGQNIDKRAVSILGAVGVVPGPAGAWRRSYLLESGGFATDTLVEDQDMTLTLLRAGRTVAYEERAIAYTETPHSVKNFLKQRFRWVYGTMQCFWKHKGVIVERPFSSMTLIVMPNIFFFNIVLPLTYPFADISLLIGLFISDWQGLIVPFALFTLFDGIYAAIGVWPEKNRFKLLCMVPLQRIAYRQLLYYSVMRGVVRAIEGTGSGWNKFAKVGETQRFYFNAVPASAPITHAEIQIPVLTELTSTKSADEVSSTLLLSESQEPKAPTSV